MQRQRPQREAQPEERLAGHGAVVGAYEAEDADVGGGEGGGHVEEGVADVAAGAEEGEAVEAEAGPAEPVMLGGVE